MEVIPKGTVVRQKVKVIEGEIMQTRFNEEKSKLEYLVQYPDDDGDGQPQSRWFADDEIEPKPAEPTQPSKISTKGSK